MTKKSPVTLLKGGFFDRPFMDSRVKTRSVTRKELILGHLVGPLGLIFVVNTIAALVEKFFTQQTSAMYGAENVAMIQQMGGYYEIIMTVAKILAVFTGLFTGWLMQHTQSRQGRMRPWYLIFGFVSIIIGALIFLFPGTTLGESYWYYFFFLLICYNTVGGSFFYLFRDNICSLTTRNPVEKTRLKFIRQMSWTLISGIVIGMLVNMVVLPMWLEHDITGYAKFMIVLCILAIPLLLIEYFYTKERVIEDIAVEVGVSRENNIPLREQLKALLTNRYYMIFMILMTASGIVDNFKGGNVQYFYIKFLLGGDENPFMFTLYQIITGTPLGIGAIIIYPLAKKFGIRNISLAGYAMVLAGSSLGWMFPDNIQIAMAAGFVRQLGYIPNAYITATLLCFAFDSVEYKSGFRLEGLLGVSVIGMVQSVIYAPFAGGFESSILKLGFVDMVGVTPNSNVLRFMTMAFYLFDIILAAAYLILLPFMDVEKHLPEISSTLTKRRKDAVLARGEEWIEPEELERREKEAADREHEENRIFDLKKRCEAKGLDFDTENAKYLAKRKKKQQKRLQKNAKRTAEK
ncbi:MFS transporter [Lachnoclostridium sp. An169]|uniref:MFS transporter n=1 Tax=Lachnoclostridium sp. An169 TaxID=1965569 RepID=UPI001123EFE9|nr:MFS transporter [Lachnoclostridium sp. An169]